MVKGPKNSSFFVAILCSFVAIVLTIAKISPIFSKFRENDESDLKSKMVILAFQVVDQYQADLRIVAEQEAKAKEEKPQIQARGLASVDESGPEEGRPEASPRKIRKSGLIGKDPWGRPYHFAIYAGLGKSRILMVSTGPDGILQTVFGQTKPTQNDDVQIDIPLSDKTLFQ